MNPSRSPATHPASPRPAAHGQAYRSSMPPLAPDTVPAGRIAACN